jgi:hypothetical protein
MNKTFMKIVASLMFILITISSMPVNAFINEPSYSIEADVDNDNTNFNADEFKAYSLSFKEDLELIKKTVRQSAESEIKSIMIDSKQIISEKIQEAMKESNLKNIDQAKEMVRQIDLKSRGFIGTEEYYMKRLDELASEGIIIEDFTVYIPISMNASGYTYYGMYEGVPMYTTFMEYTAAPIEITSNSNTSFNFMKGSVDLYMAVTTLGWKYTIPYAALSWFIKPVNSADYMLTRLKQDVTERLIHCQDVDGIYGPTSSYVLKYTDMKKYVAVDVHYMYSDPDEEDCVSREKTYWMYTQNYNDASKIRPVVYDYYSLMWPVLTLSAPNPSISYK